MRHQIALGALSLALASPALAGMVFNSRSSIVHVSTYAGPANPGPPFSEGQSTTSLDPWFASVVGGSTTSADASQYSVLSPEAVTFLATVGIGGGAGHGGGSVESTMVVQFSIDEPHAYDFNLSFGWYFIASARFTLTRSGGGGVFDRQFFTGSPPVHLSGFLDAGTYTYSTQVSATTSGGISDANGNLAVVVPSVSTLAALGVVPFWLARRR